MRDAGWETGVQGFRSGESSSSSSSSKAGSRRSTTRTRTRILGRSSGMAARINHEVRGGDVGGIVRGEEGDGGGDADGGGEADAGSSSGDAGDLSFEAAHRAPGTRIDT